ncbi:MAG TPA: hypothetical protein PK280_19775, partial [Planctomycetota bacterium]|nr:hypothetical protein [Planctomycetota bacterium]
IRALGRIGPAAKEALPALRAALQSKRNTGTARELEHAISLVSGEVPAPQGILVFSEPDAPWRSSNYEYECR